MQRFRLLTTVVLAAVAMLAVMAGPAVANHDASGAIHPGVQTTSPTGQCTANFIFDDGTDVFIGQAAHCTGTGEATDTNGCTAGSLPLEDTKVQIQGADHPGTLAYSSWVAMQAVDESDPNACAYNDFALVRLHPDDHDEVDPSIPVFGGPHGVDTDGAASGESVYTYGNSSLRLGLTQLSPHVGTSLGTTGDRWTSTIYTVTPGLPGDSGSAVVSQDGEALGILVTLGLAPLPASNGVTSLDRALNYARDKGGMSDGLSLVDGSEPFSGNILSVLGGLTG